MIIRNAEIEGVVTDVQLADGAIAKIGRGISGDKYFDAKGGVLIPGLHDHHIHLNATAAAMNSVRCGPPEVNSEAELIQALNASGEGWLRGVGYHHSVAGEIDRKWLDKHGPKRPVRIQHRSGRLWILNSLAMAKMSITKPSNGRLLDGDVSLRGKSHFPDLTPLVNRLLSYGMTGVTEVTPSNGLVDWMKKLGVIVVTQPNFITEREAAYVKDVPFEDHRNLWRLKAFHEAGLKLAAGSDAPFGDPNPWAAMAAAVARPAGFEAEAITPEEALEIYTKPFDDAGADARIVVVGEPADLCLLDRSWLKARESFSDVKVQATWITGELVYNGVD